VTEAELKSEAHSAVAIGIAECFLQQPHSMAWEERTDQLATAAIEAMQLFISMHQGTLVTLGDLSEPTAPTT
jgi:hypothetical protein